MSNPLAELAKTGQSVWYDQMERKLLTSGRLEKMIREDDLRGLTSNPTIFEKAIGGSEDYDGQLGELASQRKSRDEIYDELVIDDISKAADLFRPVWQKTHGDDGFVSLEVSPLLARDTAGTVAEAKRLFERLGRPNVMIKIPATEEGIPAIEQTIANGINVNVTLIFSNDVYARVIEAYLRGLEARVSKGLPVGDIASVASFFVSRIDAAADKQIEAKKKEDPSVGALAGKIAIANARMAYQLFKQVFSSDRFLKLRDAGARVQRPLWASTGTKNPAYSDVLYVDSLIGPDTVNTLPPTTYEAFRDHGRVIMTIEQDLDGARRTLETFEAKGFSLEAITRKLTADGVKSFEESFVSLMQTIEARRAGVVRRLSERVTLHNLAIDDAVTRAEKENIVSRIWSKDASLWKGEEAHRAVIANSLGWLEVAGEMRAKIDELVTAADELRRGFDHVVVLGMGGSSLCSEVVRRLFGKRDGYPELLVLDSTVPEAVAMLEAQIDLGKTLFIVASKSGTTTEPAMFHRYFFEKMKALKGDEAGQNFVAVTDPGTKLGADAARDRFRHVFVNRPDIGGRYSALSLFGLVPMALSGVDVRTLIARAADAATISTIPKLRKNPAALLGAAIGSSALQGRDKLTLVARRPLDALGLWVEQLVAESTGKEGKGIVPVAGEPELPAGAYADDRLFVSVRLQSGDGASRVRELAAAGKPVVDIVLEDPLDLGETFFLFEFATAVAGAFLGINPFDQPNVQESKDNTRRLLGELAEKGRLDEGTPAQKGDDAAVAELLSRVRPGDYVALTEYFGETAGRDALIARIRQHIGGALGVATTTGYGPRFLHSTGQLHKGGGDNGVFLQITADSPDISIPGENLTFGQLARAQALGDFQSLATRNRRALRIHLGDDVEGGLAWLAESVDRAAKTTKTTKV